MNVVCCQVEVSATGRSSVKRSSTECGLCECDREASTGSLGPKRAVTPQGKNMKDKYLLFPNAITKIYSLALGSKGYNFIQNMKNIQRNFSFYYDRQLFVLVCKLHRDSTSNLDYGLSNGRKITEYLTWNNTRKSLWPNSRYCPEIRTKYFEINNRSSDRNLIMATSEYEVGIPHILAGRRILRANFQSHSEQCEQNILSVRC